MSDIQALEREIKAAEEIIEQNKLALKLSANREFRKLILEEYFVNEAARMVQLSGDPVLDPAQRADVLAMAQATGHFKRWLVVMNQRADMAERSLPEMRETLEELRAIEARG